MSFLKNEKLFNKIWENIKFKLGFCIKKKKQLRNIYLIISNKNKFYNIKLYQNNIIRDFYFKMKFYIYKKIKEEVVVSNKISRSNIYFDIKINKQFIGQYEKNKKYFRDNKVFYYISHFLSYERSRWFFAKRNRANWYGLSRIFGEPTFSTWTQSLTDENIHFKNFRAYQKWRKPKIFGSYGISKIREVDLFGWLKNKLSKIFGYFHYLSNNNLKYNGNNINQIYEKKLSDLESDYEENYSQILKNSEESKPNFIYKLQKFLLSWAEIKIKTKEEPKKKKKTIKKNYKLFDINDYIIKQFLNPNKVDKIKSFKDKNKDNNEEKTGFWYDYLFEKFLLKDYWITENILHYSKKDKLPVIFLLVDWFIIIKHNIVCDKNISIFIDILLNFNENIFEYLLLFAYFLFFIGITNSILKFIYNWLLNFNLEKSKNWFKLKKFFDRNRSYYNFYEYYNRSFSKFYNEKKSMNIDSIIFFKDLIKYSIKNNKVINRNEYLFTKWRESAVKSDEKNKELNSLLNVYSLLTQLTVTKNFRDNIIWLISKQRSKFWRHLKRTLNFKNMEQYYLWDYFNQHIFDEMFFNIVLKETSFNTILKDKNKLKNYKLDNFYSNSLFYNKFSNIGISEKNWIFRYDSDFKNIKALKSEIKDMSNISWYSRDWFRSRTEMFDLPTSKLKKKLKLIKSQPMYIYSLDWDFLYYIFKNSFKIFLFFFLLHYIILTELWLTLLTLLTLLVIIILYNIFFRISIKKIITSLITLLLALLFIFIISYILYNIYYIYLCVLYNIYDYNISDYLRLINDKNMYTSFILEYLKYNGLFSWIIKCIHLLETKRNNIRFDGFVNLDLLMKEFYLNGFKNWPKRSSFDNFFPFFRRWFYKIKIKRNEAEEQENYKIIKEKAIERAKKTLSQINDTATFKSYFDFSFSTLIQEQYYKYLRDPYYKINYVQAHLILWFVQAYNENLAKISKLSKVYENYYYLYLQKTNLILKIYFISKPKYYIYIQKIQWFFYFNRKIIGSVKYILLGMFISILIIFLYLYFILKTYLNLISKNEIITRDFYLIWLNKYHKKILFSDNFIIKTINDSRFINKFRFFLLKQQFKLLAETSNIKIMIK